MKAMQSIAQKDFVAGRKALRVALEKHFAVSKNSSPKKIQIKNRENGEPYLRGNGDLYCSIAHSFGAGAGAVAPFRVGIDIEKLRPHQGSLLPYIATDKEVALVRRFFGKKTDALTLIWTIKESVMKALGLGFAISPKELRLTKQTRGHFEVKVHNKIPSRWHVRSIDKGDYYMSVAYEKTSKKRSFYRHREASISFASA